MMHKVFNSIIAIIMLSTILIPNIPVKALGQIQIRPPFNGTFRMTSFFDHYYPNYSAYDPEVTIYNGDSSPNESPYHYHGHSGFDWALPENTPIIAVADGVVRFAQRTDEGGYGKYIQIQHQNEYITLYAHLNNVFVNDEAFVNAGDIIGESGNTGASTGAHLHFGVYHGPNASETYATDPYGWTGSAQDPLINYPAPGQGNQANCLWRGFRFDSISCDETIIEDKGIGFSIYGSWYESENGSGSHLYSIYNSTNPSNIAIWRPGNIRPGIYQVYAYVPLYSGTPGATSCAKYYLYTSNSNYEITLDLRTIPDLWISLGVFQLSGNDEDFIVLNVQTNEPPYSTIVLADAIKFRTNNLFIPSIKKYIPVY